jgi:catechol 2,3-dioxygenase-like lactoylglutathione lyase family enzyme
MYMSQLRKQCQYVTLLCYTALLAACAQTEDETQVNPLQDFGIAANNAFFYYDDLDAATVFYTATLGLNLIADYGFAKILQIATTSYLTLVDGTKGMHTTDEPKTVAIALITDQLDEWHAYLTGLGVEMRSGYDPVEGRPHHGFVVFDPEGYYLEFERFNVHPENRDLMPLLQRAVTISPAPGRTALVPEGLGFKATVLWLYYSRWIKVGQRSTRPPRPGLSDWWTNRGGCTPIPNRRPSPCPS